MWEWVQKAKQFINRAINRVLSRPEIQKLITRNQEIYLGNIDNLVTSLITDEISVGEWENSMRTLIKREYIQLYLLGRGGRDQMTRKDYSSIGGMLGRDQFKYLHQFATQITNGELTPGQILARSRMYVRSAREAYNRAQGRAYGIPDGALPAYPGDGKACEGLVNCQCQWDIKEVYGGWNCYWRLGEAEHCKLCIKHEKDWNPFYVVRSE